jgi:membrane protein DedA with SNARE-associated domain
VFDWLVRAVLGFVQRYGYLAVFVYMILETAFVLHFVPSEVVVPFAASQLVHDPVSFVLFVADTTAGASVGSVLAYASFGRYGERLLERYGHVVHVSEADIERSQAVFRRYGESSVFWARMLPFLRALISIPAGLAEMDLRRFVLYSTAGAALFNTGLTYLVYTGAGTTSPLEVVLGVVRTRLRDEFAYVAAHTRFVLVLLGLALLVAAAVWAARGWIRANPDLATLLALHVVRLVGLTVGAVFVLGALSSPRQAFAVVTGVWNDPLFLVELGFSDRVALLLTGVLVAFAGLIAYEVGTLVELARVRAAVGDALARIRR